jgi:hypothetical protein
VQSFFQWFAGTAGSSDAWLVLGKGPSYALRDRFDLSSFHLMSLNHAVREQPVLAAHMIDLDVVRDCSDTIEQNARVLVMPWYPHVHNAVGARPLEELAGEIPVLQRLRQEGRLLWYDLSTSPIRHGSAPVVEATYFSAEAALNLLAAAGVRRVRSLGIDGGSAYSPAFEDLRDKTLLANGRTSFDLQFEGFARTIARTGVDFSPLDRPAPARVLSAFTRDEALAVAVLHHSIRRRASLTVETMAIPDGSEASIEGGQTVILPPRAQVLADLRSLWGESLPALDVLIAAGSESGSAPGLAIAGPGLAKCLAELASAIRSGAAVDRLALTGVTLRPVISPEWSPAAIAASGANATVLSYPADGSEPWLARDHPLGHLWVRDLLDAIAHNQIAPELVAEQVSLGYARPSLLYQVEHRIEEPLLLPRRARQLDRAFDEARRHSLRKPTVRWRPILGAVARQVGRWTRELKGAAAPR